MMMRKALKKLFVVVLILFFIVVILTVWFQIDTRVHPPVPADLSATELRVENPDQDFYTCGKNWIQHGNSGLWELYIEGKPFERGVIEGKLTKGLIEKQEQAFISQIAELIPSPSYLKFLKYFIYWFNRDLEDYIPEEYRKEIYGISLSASDKFSFIGTNYQRLLNYHSAHDIGHALQDLHMVGCTSFGVWGDRSKDGSLLIGRNFDFYVGDKFAENKIVCFEKPDQGYPFMMITWGGMAGAVSGMNEQGLTVTINAAKSDIPWSSRTPISILTREILQYAKNIREAYLIAEKRKTFVSESILVGSVADGKAVIIEKSPFKISLVETQENYIVSANHFRSATFMSDPKNLKDIKDNASLYRYKRVLQDITNDSPVDASGIATILSDRSGLNGASIGMGNEKAINQLIAHHSIIFDPARHLVWVSNGPWQIGGYTCYNTYKIFHNFAGLHRRTEISEQDKLIPPDSFLGSEDYKRFIRFRELRKEVKTMSSSGSNESLQCSLIRELISTNPDFFEAYSLSGDYFFSKNRPDSAVFYYKKALGKVIPRENERQKIIEKLAECLVQLKKKKT
ncbi:MAG: C45 family autoproteolytic acyltransferase/hydrolase [Bacteroidetes bacterium]|nr:C45 family autoproteolytic acyltransferase/hydrolase [Bacteroidota bacterium]